MADRGDADFQRRAWNEAGTIYRERQDWPLDRVHYGSLLPDESALNLLGDVAGKRALVLGCGGGENGIALARQGALVTGIDVSDRQIAHAQERAEAEGVTVTLVRGPAHELGFLPAASQDLALAVYVFPYVAEIAQALAALHRVLRPGGRLVLSQDHPLRASFWDGEREEEVALPARNYFDPAPLAWPFVESGTAMISHHRTLGQWIDLLHAAGFRLARLLEFPLPPDIADDPWADEYTRETAPYLPQSMILVAERS